MSDSMSERSLRDVDRWKDKIEVRLDNRQVFFLFFGSALVACLLFILGVMVGKRLESRGKAVAPEIEDPLALLDKIAASPAAAAEPQRTAPRAAAPAPPEPAARPVPAPAQPLPAAAHVEPTPALPLGEPPKGKGRFSLQLGSFPDRAEAEAFAKQFGAYVVPTEIPGRGLWYRVRTGDFPGPKEAIAGKLAFEKQHNVIAYVVAATPTK